MPKLTKSDKAKLIELRHALQRRGADAVSDNILAGLIQQAIPLLLSLVGPLLRDLFAKLIGDILTPAEPADPAVPVTPPPPPPSPAEPAAQIEGWLEEAWHDWFNGDEGANGDWAPSGSAVLNEIISGERNLPPGATVRFLVGKLPQPPWLPRVSEGKPAPFVVTHHIVLGDDEYAVPSSTPDKQVAADLGHIQFGPRWREHDGWSLAVQLAAFAGSPKKLTYYASYEHASGTIKSDPVTITVAARKGAGAVTKKKAAYIG